MSRPQFQPLVLTTTLRLPTLSIDNVKDDDQWNPPPPLIVTGSTDGRYARNNISPLLDNDVQIILKLERFKSPIRGISAGSPLYSPVSAGQVCDKLEPLIPHRVGKRFILGHKVGNGSFGTIYAGKNILSGENVAIKIEPLKTKAPQLLYESRLYKMIGMDISAQYMTSYNLTPSSPIRSSFSVNGAKSPLSLPPCKEGKYTLRYINLLDDDEASGNLQLIEEEKEKELPFGFPRLHWYGVEESHNIMIIDFLGPSLEDLFEFCRRKFSLKTVLILADQFISRIEYLHAKNVIHRGTDKFTNLLNLQILNLKIF
jgi:serine/threonine protein kinase